MTDPPQNWVTHLPHFLDESGNLVQDMPAEARHLAEALGRLIMFATHDDEVDEPPPCFVVVEGKRCEGEVGSCISPHDASIVWECEKCGSRGVITGWKGTFWDLMEQEILGNIHKKI